MKLLLDQGLPRSTVLHLKDAGIDAEHVGDLNLANSSDAEILDAARQRHAAVVTLDADFHQLLALTRANSPSVIRVRIEGLRGDRLAAVLAQVLSVAPSEVSAGAVVSVTPSKIRVRSLPIG